MLQDVVASLILNAPEAVTWDFAMCTLEVPHANAGLIEQALYETLDRASKAMTLDRATDAGTVHTVQFEKALPKVV
jgi:hypothetical protein